MANIIIRESQSMRFKPHMNMALGKYIHTKKEYLGEMKRQGCEPYRPQEVKQYKPSKYKTSQWAHDMVRAAKRNTDKHGNVHLSGAMREELHKANMKEVPKEAIQQWRENSR